MSYCSRLCPLACLLLVGSAVNARSVPPVNVRMDVGLSPGFPEGLNTFGTIARSDSSLGSADASVFGAPSPLISARALVSPNALLRKHGAVSDIRLHYFFRIDGPAGIVPVDISAAGLATGAGGAGAAFGLRAGWFLFDPVIQRNIAGFQIIGAFTGNFEKGLISADEVQLTTNHLYSIELFAHVEAAADVPGADALAQAFVDPVLLLGVGVDPNLYSFVFSSGIGNTAASAAAPEPAPLTPGLPGLLCRLSPATAPEGARGAKP